MDVKTWRRFASRLKILRDYKYAKENYPTRKIKQKINKLITNIGGVMNTKNMEVAASNQVVSSFQGGVQYQTSNPFSGNAKIAVDAFNEVLLGLRLKYPPDSPTLTATNDPATEVELMWIDNTNNAEGFKIMRRQKVQAGNFSNFAMIAQVSATARAYRDSNLTSGTTYHYQLLAFNARGESLSTALEITIRIPSK